MPDAEKARRAAVYEAAWCIRKREERDGLAKLSETHGVTDSAAFATAWATASQKAPTGARATMDFAAEQACSKAP